MFSTLGYKTLIVFGVFNFLSLPLVYLFFPETKGRTLEEINLLFAAESPIASANEREYHRLLNEAGGNVAVAERQMMEDEDMAVGEKFVGEVEKASFDEKA